ncbi:MAG: hypothetical protein HN368_13925 [Spirochaetales bacterium]|jgi:hypothetical protein|nr:hypothetical protein [Spirochaetales bacterium]
MRKLGVLAICMSFLILWGGTTVAAQTGPNLSPLYNELGILFEEIGNDTAPHLQSFALAMEGTGAAEIGPHFFFSFSSGTTILPGFLTFRAGDNPFNLFDIDALLSDAMEPGTVADIYQLTESFFVNPGMRFSLGIGLANGLEFFGYFGIIPQVLLNAVVPLIPVDGLEGLVFNRLNGGIRVRKILTSDQDGIPATSLAAGYSYTQFNAGLSNLDALPLDGLELSGFGLELSGTMTIATNTHNAGLEFALSKKLGFFVPFMRFGAWYQWTEYSAGIQDLVITMSSDVLTEPLSASGTDPAAAVLIKDLSFIPSVGFELMMKKTSIIVSGSYNTSAGSIGANVSLQFRI